MGGGGLGGWTTENKLSTQGKIFTVSIVICKLLDPQLTWLLQGGALVLLVYYITKKMTQSLSIQSLQLSVLDIILLANYMVKIGHKADSCIICGLTLLPTIIRKNINQLKALQGEKSTEPPRYWNAQPPWVHFKYFTATTNTSPMVLDIMGRLNRHAVDNGDV